MERIAKDWFFIAYKARVKNGCDRLSIDGSKRSFEFRNLSEFWESSDGDFFEARFCCCIRGNNSEFGSLGQTKRKMFGKKRMGKEGIL